MAAMGKPNGGLFALEAGAPMLPCDPIHAPLKNTQRERQRPTLSRQSWLPLGKPNGGLLARSREFFKPWE